jgi:hypothetical protein
MYFLIAFIISPRNLGFSGFIGLCFLIFIAIKYLKQDFFLSDEDTKYSETVKNSIFKAICQTSKESIIHTTSLAEADKEPMEAVLARCFKKKQKNPSTFFLKPIFKDIFICQKADNITFFFGSLECKFEDNYNLYDGYYNFHFLKISNSKRLNQIKYEIFSAEKLNGAISSYGYKEGCWLLCVLIKHKESDVLSFDLDIFESLRKSETLEKIQKTFYTNLHSFEDLILLFD